MGFLLNYYVYSAGVGRTGVFSYILLCLQCCCRAYRGFLSYVLLCLQCWCRAYRGFLLYIIMFTVLGLGIQGFSSIYYYVYSADVGRTGVFFYILLCLQFWCRSYRGFLLHFIMFTVLGLGVQRFSSIYYYVYSADVGRTDVFFYILLCLQC